MFVRNLTSSLLVYVLFVSAAFVGSAQDKPATPPAGGASRSLMAPEAQKPASSPVAVPARPVEDMGKSLPKDTVVLAVGEHKLTVEDFEKLMNALPARQRATVTPQFRRSLAEALANWMVLADEARKLGYDKDEAMKTRIWMGTEQSLSQYFAERYRENVTVTPEEVKAYYDQNLGKYEEFRVSHILIRPKGQVPPPAGMKELTEEEAKVKAEALRQQVTAPGADFAAVATAESYDKTSAARGGDLGFVSRGKLVPDFENAAYRLAVGQISEPVKTSFGWHIIKLTDKRTKPLAEVQAEIDTKLRNDKQKTGLDGFSQTAHIAYNEIYFPKLPASAPRPGGPAGPRVIAPGAGGPQPTVRPVVVPAQPQPAK